ANAVLGVSKATKLVCYNRRVTEMLNNHEEPCMLNLDKEVRQQFHPFPIKLLGRIYIARLSAEGFVFRIDIDDYLSEDEGVESVRSLVSSDILYQGYPETLRLAHILSSFTFNEVLGIQRHLSQQYDIRINRETSIRRSLFGPFSTSSEDF
ncbi:MAG: hypothetical protein QXF26_06890, partial [Candidatus Bathyarchaeia archaeon]